MIQKPLELQQKICKPYWRCSPIDGHQVQNKFMYHAKIGLGLIKMTNFCWSQKLLKLINLYEHFEIFPTSDGGDHHYITKDN
jgi:hypothetical protein